MWLIAFGHSCTQPNMGVIYLVVKNSFFTKFLLERSDQTSCVFLVAVNCAWKSYFCQRIQFSSCWTGVNVQECADGEKSMVSSSYVWICMTGQRGTDIAVADANNLASVLNQFHVSSSHILCIAGVPGTSCLWPSFVSYAYSHYWSPVHAFGFSNQLLPEVEYHADWSQHRHAVSER